MNLPPIPAFDARQHWICYRCRRLFLWEKDALIQPVIRHAFACQGDNLAQIAGNQIGAEKSEN